MENNKKIFIILICVFLIILCGGIYLYFKVPNVGYRTEVPTEKAVKDMINNNLFPKNDYDVVLKDNIENSGKTEIYLKDKDTGVERLLISLTGVVKGEFNPVEFHKGDIYLMVRNVVNNGFIDELWKYNLSGEGKKIYSGGSPTFMVSKTQDKIILIKNAYTNNDKILVIMDLDGKVLKDFENSEISVYSEFSDDFKKEIKENEISFTLFKVAENFVFIQNSNIAWTVGMTRIDLSSMSIEKYNFSALGIVSQDYGFNPSMNKVVFSNYPETFNFESVKEFEKAKNNKVSFYYYDLKLKNSILIGTGYGKRFYPSWVDDNNFRYADPTEVIPEFGSITKWITKNISEINK